MIKSAVKLVKWDYICSLSSARFTLMRTEEGREEIKEAERRTEEEEEDRSEEKIGGCCGKGNIKERVGGGTNLCQGRRGKQDRLIQLMRNRIKNNSVRSFVKPSKHQNAGWNEENHKKQNQLKLAAEKPKWAKDKIKQTEHKLKWAECKIKWAKHWLTAKTSSKLILVKNVAETPNHQNVNTVAKS